MRVLFPSRPFEPGSVDPAFAAERAAAEAAGLETLLVDGEALDDGCFDQAVRRLPDVGQDDLVVFRGWMMRADTYAALHEALARRGYRLINDPAQYRHTHHLPESYEVIREHTPRTAWTTSGRELELAAVMHLLAPFGDAALIVKDYVKSQKHYWHEACFIPSARDAEAVRRVASRFLELQDDGLTGGLVFRELVELEPLTTHSKSGMPLTKEFRTFFLDRQPLVSAEYWEEGAYDEQRPPRDLFVEVAARVNSRLFTMDVAHDKAGRWIILELGDGQVAGLPGRLDPSRFYAALAARAALTRRVRAASCSAPSLHVAGAEATWWRSRAGPRWARR